MQENHLYRESTNTSARKYSFNTSVALGQNGKRKSQAVDGIRSYGDSMGEGNDLVFGFEMNRIFLHPLPRNTALTIEGGGRAHVVGYVTWERVPEASSGVGKAFPNTTEECCGWDW